MPIRVIQWATGGVGRAAIEGVLSHPDLELAGAWVHSPDKQGRDVGEVLGLGQLGVRTTGSLEEVCALGADARAYVVVYAPLVPVEDEVLALLLHVQHLEDRFGVGPHTISVPRLQPAPGVNLATFPHLVSDDQFLKLVAILRLAVPYTGMIISTRETPEMRAKALRLGVSQISAGSSVAKACSEPSTLASKSRRSMRE